MGGGIVLLLDGMLLLHMFEKGLTLFTVFMGWVVSDGTPTFGTAAFVLDMKELINPDVEEALLAAMLVLRMGSRKARKTYKAVIPPAIWDPTYANISFHPRSPFIQNIRLITGLKWAPLVAATIWYRKTKHCLNSVSYTHLTLPTKRIV